MNPRRAIAALAAMLTALLVQATLIGPLTLPVPVSLPAVLVAAVALVDGPGAGIALGFASGLVADLASDHQAGVLALAWLVVGLVAGRCAAPYASVRRDAAIAALAAGVATTAGWLVVVVLDQGRAGLLRAALDVVPATGVDALLALLVVPITRLFLRTPSLRAPRPVLLLGTPR